MNRYTFFAEYLGGTYVSQVEADSFEHAPARWVKSLKQTDSVHFDEKFKTELIKSMDSPPSPIEGLLDTWCFSSLFGDNLLLVHFTLNGDR